MQLILRNTNVFCFRGTGYFFKTNNFIRIENIFGIQQKSQPSRAGFVLFLQAVRSFVYRFFKA